jgi:hypothetical protein
VFTSCLNRSFVKVRRCLLFEIRIHECLNLDDTHYLFILRMCNRYRRPLASNAFLSCMMYLCDIRHVCVWLRSPASLEVRCVEDSENYCFVTACVFMYAFWLSNKTVS